MVTRQNKIFLESIFVCGAGLLITALIFVALQKQEESVITSLMHERASGLISNLQKKIFLYQFGLRGLRGAYISIDGSYLTSKKFAQYSNSRNYMEEFPGAMGFGFIRRVAPNQESSFLKEMRADHRPQFAIKQLEPNAGDKYVIELIHPFDSNSQALGLDIASEHNRFMAAQRSMRTGHIEITAPVTLVQKANQLSSGFLILLPYYSTNVIPASVEEREKLLLGWIYAPLVIGQVLNDYEIKHAEEIVELLDVTDAQQPVSFFKSLQSSKDRHPNGKTLLKTFHFKSIGEYVLETTVFGRKWQLRYTAGKLLLNHTGLPSKRLVTIAGTFISILLGFLWYFWSSSRKKEKLVIDSNALLAAIVDSSQDAIIGKDLKGYVLSWNKGAENLFGYSQREAIGKRLMDLVVPEELSHEDQAILTSIAEGKKVPPFETVRINKLGKQVQVSVSVSPVRDDSGNIVNASKSVRDITAQKEAEQKVIQLNKDLELKVLERTEQLESTNYFLRTVTDSLPVLIGYWNAELKCQFANKHYLPIFGKNISNIIDQPMREIIGADLYDKNIAYIEGALAGHIQRFERTIIKEDGHPFHTITNYIPDIHDGKVKGFFVLSSDVTELKEAELKMLSLNDALNERTQQAEAASKAKSDFVANMSHEIRTPMNAVIGLTQLLLGTTLTDKQHDYLSKISVASTSLLGILNDILDYSKIEAGRMQIERRGFNLETLIKGVADIFTLPASTKNIELIFGVAENVPQVIMSDQLRITQILNNLIGNAIKFTSSGRVKVNVAYSHSTLSFEINDSGIGMSEDQVKAIFQPFVQADVSTTRKFGGTGLGLAITQHLVRLLEGEIGVSSELGKGSTFWFNLPVEVTDNINMVSHTQLSNIGKVLIVDDSEESRKILSAYLDQWGISWVQADSAESGLSTIIKAESEKVPFDLLLIDWKMPSKSGLWLAQEIRQAYIQKELQKLPVIAMVTAYDKDELVKEAVAFEVQPKAYLTKPILPSQFFDLLSQCSGLQRSISAISTDTNKLDTIDDIRGARILLVEDNLVNQEVASAILERLDLHVTVVNNGAEAVEECSQENFDLVLMDIQMPVMDGFEATAKIRMLENWSTKPIIALSAAALDEDRKKSMSAGMNGHLAKPINVDDLKETLIRFISLKESNLVRGSSENAGPPSISGLDVDATIRRLGVNWSLMERFLKSYQAQFADWAIQFEDAVSQKDLEVARRLAHTLKGASLNIGANEIVEAAAQLEQNPLTVDEVGYNALKLKLEHLILEIKTKLIDKGPQVEVGSASREELINILNELEDLLARHKAIPKTLRDKVDILSTNKNLETSADRLIRALDSFAYKDGLSEIDAMKKVLNDETSA